MAKNRFSMLPKLPSPVPSAAINDDDDDDICPVCDGECTCRRPQDPPSQPSAPLTIKLTVPASLRKPPDPAFQPKRRGRPPKALVAARQKKNTNIPPRPKPTKKAPKRRRVVASSSSDLSDVDHHYSHPSASSTQFPTFVSAGTLSSRASSSSASSDSESDLSSLSFDDSDSSIQAEEENFILSEIHDRARVRRDHKDNTWVIRARKKSVGPSDPDLGPDNDGMDVDSDATVEADVEQDDDDDPDDQDDDTDTMVTGAGYSGVATGWSEDDGEESSFDADLFFANLSDSDSSANGSSSDHADHEDASADNDNESDMDPMESSLTALPAPPPEFEVTEGWDGSIVFTNGAQHAISVLDHDFEAHAALLAETSDAPASPSHSSQDSADDDDVEMSLMSDAGYEREHEGDGGETTDEELVGDDDLPNERAMRLFNLPFSVSAINPMSTMSPAVSPGPRDRKPFPFPSFSANSTKSSLDSPKPADILSGKVMFWDDSEDEFDCDEVGTTKSGSGASSSWGGGPRKGVFVPSGERRQAIIDDAKKDIPSPHPRFRRRRVGDANANPNPNSNLFSHYKTVEHLLKRHLASSQQHLQSPIAPPPSPFHLSVGGADDTALALSPELAHAELIDLNDVLEAAFLDPDPPSDSQNTDTGTENEKEQDGGLSSARVHNSTPSSKPHAHLRSLSRWDVISVGAFRQSREAADGAGWGSDTHSPMGNKDYTSMMKSSPLSTMLWQNKAGGRRSRKMSAVISPVILPVRDRDGDRTPTNHLSSRYPHHQHQQQQQLPPLRNEYPQKSRKELRREQKLKRKSFGPTHHAHQHHQHHSHHHHPNAKSRSSSAAQRTNFFMGGVPPLNL